VDPFTRLSFSPCTWTPSYGLILPLTFSLRTVAMTLAVSISLLPSPTPTYLLLNLHFILTSPSLTLSIHWQRWCCCCLLYWSLPRRGWAATLRHFLLPFLLTITPPPNIRLLFPRLSLSSLPWRSSLHSFQPHSSQPPTWPSFPKSTKRISLVDPSQQLVPAHWTHFFLSQWQGQEQGGGQREESR